MPSSKPLRDGFLWVVFYLLFPIILFSQQPQIAHRYFTKAKQFQKSAKLDSSNIYLEKASDIYAQIDSIEKYTEAQISIADNFNRLGKYSDAERILLQIKKTFSKGEVRNELMFSELLISLGNTYLLTGKFDDAYSSYYKALTIRQDKLPKNNPDIADCFHSLGNVYYYKGNSDSALFYYWKALKIRLNAYGEKHIRVAQNYNNIGVIYRNKAEYNQALIYYKKAQQILIELLGENNPSIARTYENIGDIYFYKGLYNKALENHKIALKLVRKAYGENHPEVALNLENMAADYKFKGNYQKALELEQKALAIKEKVLEPDHFYFASTYNMLGVLYEDLAEYDKAIAFQKKSIRILNRIFGNKPSDVFMNYNNIANCYKKKNQYKKAIEYYTKAITACIKKRGPEYTDLATIYNNLGNSYAELKEYDKAIEFYNKSLNLREKIFGDQHPDLAIQNYENFGILYLKKGDYEKALNYFSKAEKLILKSFGRRSVFLARIKYEQGKVFQAQQNYQQALALFQQALISLSKQFNQDSIFEDPSPDDVTDRLLLADIQQSKGNAFMELYRLRQKKEILPAAIKEYVTAMETINQVQTGYSYEGSKLALSEKLKKITESILNLSAEFPELLRSELYLSTAFNSMEMAKASVLREAIHESHTRKFSGIPDSLLRKERILKEDLVYYETVFREQQNKKSSEDTSNITYFENKYFETKIQYDRLIHKLESQFPNYYRIKYGNSIATISDIQSHLNESDALIEYFIGDRFQFAIVITKQSANLVQLNADSDLTNNIWSLLRSIRKYDKKSFIQYNFPVSRILYAPLHEYLNRVKHITIIPDGILCYLPFEVLAKNRETGGGAKEDRNSFSEMNFLIKQYDISYHHSATLFLKTSLRQNKETNEDFAGFAPVFDGDQKAFYFADRGGNRKMQELSEDSLMRSVLIKGNRYSPLPYSAKEITKIAKLFRSEDLKAQVFLRKEATEERFKNETERCKYIHLATHGVINENQPKLSGLIFSQSKNADPRKDGILYAGETYNLHLNAHLLVLSSCESGIGRLVKGEGLMSLTRGFFYAGAKNIIVSLWKVPDRQTAQLMEDFYVFVLRGYSYAYALRKAKLKMIENNTTAFPRNWSGFILLGL